MLSSVDVEANERVEGGVEDRRQRLQCRCVPGINAGHKKPLKVHQVVKACQEEVSHRRLEGLRDTYTDNSTWMCQLYIEYEKVIISAEPTLSKSRLSRAAHKRWQ